MEVFMNATETVKSVIAEQFNREPDDIREDMNLKHDLGSDSLDRVEIVMAFEEEFQTEIPDVDAENLHTVREIIDYAKNTLGVADEKDENKVAPLPSTGV
jgi:acyl carrier protein